jgi:hypothetical protein
VRETAIVPDRSYSDTSSRCCWQVLISGVISAIFLLSNFHAHLADCFPYGEGDAKKKSYVILGGMIGCHFALILLFKFYFFHYPVGA